MTPFPRLPLRSFTVFDVDDPADMDSDSRVSRRFPSSNNVNTYVLQDRALRRQPPQGAPLTRLAMRVAGDLMPGYVADRYGTEVGIAGAGANRFCLGTVLRGRMAMRCTSKGTDVRAEGSRGLVYRGEPGTRFLTGDGNARFNVWVAAPRVEQALEGMLDAPLRQPLAFAPGVDWSTGLAASLHGLLRFFASELERDDGMASNPVALRSFTDLLVQAMLQALQHTHLDRLRGGKPDLVPRHLRRAEQYMRAHADQAVSVQDVAEAAGCSLRSLHDAFRRWRDTTPLAALHRVRLERVRAELRQFDDEATPQSVMAVARRYGFTNRSRFLTAYARRFGELPQNTGRRR